MLLSCHNLFLITRVITTFSYIYSQDVVYPDIKLKPFRNASPSFNYKLRDSVDVDDVAYSAVVVSHKQSKSDTEYV